MTPLAGKHIVVTGASAGIGAELCRQLGAQGCRVVLAARRLDRLAEVAAQVAAAGGASLAAACDVTDRAQVIELAGRARERFGEIDIWVNNAGAGLRHRLLEATAEDMARMFQLNCLSALWGYQAVIPRWLEQQRGGQVIDINSVGGQAGFGYNGGYCAAKHALKGMGDSLRQELFGSGITLTTVYPGLTASEFSAQVTDRTGGNTALRTDALRKRGNFLVRNIARVQSTAEVAACIIGAMLRPRTHVYPHRWAARAGLLYRLAPDLVLRLMAGGRRGGRTTR